MNPGSEPVRLASLEGPERELAVPVLKEGFEGIYRWHAKRTLRSVSVVRGAWQGSELVGVAMLEHIAPEVGYVYYLSVGRSSRQKGVGSTLLDDALGRFRQERMQVVYAAVEEDNAPSLALFRSRGFREVDRQETHYTEGGLGAYGLRSKMWVVSGEVLLGLRLAPPSSSAGGGKRPAR
jgi:ribosomal protein S18 acetylase RimI-like enzyme